MSRDLYLEAGRHSVLRAQARHVRHALPSLCELTPATAQHGGVFIDAVIAMQGGRCVRGPAYFCAMERSHHREGFSSHRPGFGVPWEGEISGFNAVS